MTEHIGLLAAAYAFHAALSRQAAVAAQVRAMEEPSTVRAGEEQHQPPSEPLPPGRQGGLGAADPQDPATPALAVVLRGWLEAAEQAMAAGGSAQELQVLLGVAGQEGTPS